MKWKLFAYFFFIGESWQKSKGREGGCMEENESNMQQKPA